MPSPSTTISPAVFTKTEMLQIMDALNQAICVAKKIHAKGYIEIEQYDIDQLKMVAMQAQEIIDTELAKCGVRPT